MTGKERFEAAVTYQSPDRLPVAFVRMQPYVAKKLYAYFGVSNNEELFDRLGCDTISYHAPFIGWELKRFEDGSWEDMWGTVWDRLPKGAEVTYDEPIFLPYADVEELEEIEKFRFPTAEMFDYSRFDAFCEAHKDRAIAIGGGGYMDFMNGTAFARGVEQVYCDVALEDEVYLYIIQKRFELYYGYFERLLQEGKGRVSIVYVGDDLGTQDQPLVSPEKFKKLFGGYYKQIFDLAHRYGARTMMHSCGSIVSLIPTLIECGLDILEGVQVDAKGMEIESLYEKFYRKIVFYGSVSVQKTLCSPDKEEVVAEVEKRKKLFKEGGMIIGPSNVLQADMPPENLEAMCRAVGSFRE